MNNTIYLRFLSLLVFLASSLLPAQLIQAQSTEPAYVILVSYDGFRSDYVEKYQAPNFQAFIRKGAAAEGLIPSYPSKTFPNHYTIITGMYPGHHGLVDNTFYAKDLGRKYSTSNREVVQDPVFYGGLPLWQLAQQHGLKSASFFWVGSEAPVQGQFPTYYYLYDGSIPNTQRVDQAMQWLQLPDSLRPRLITLYFSLTDDAGHDYGPNSPELEQAVLESDHILGRLMAGLDTIPLPVNVVLCSDHGMREMHTTVETYIVLDDLPGYADTTITWISNGTHVQIYCRDAATCTILEQKLQRQADRFDVHTRNTFPERWRYQHPRVGDILLVAKPGHYFTGKNSRYLKKALEHPGEQLPAWGTHGFDPGACTDMYGIFYANGPQIEPGSQLPAFENVHIYPLVARLLGLSSPADIDGRLEVLVPVLRKD
ncbi:MAG: alkaline phosphatase family protein [Bacteroidetes bacterium]|nr:MAG: alkaline phosphatase family protein [Bacteroidota bacterium]